MQKEAIIKPKQQFPLTIKRLGINGEGVGYFKRTVVFVPGALPGEEVVVEAKRIHPKYVEGIAKKVRKRSPHRVKPRARFTSSAAAASSSTLRTSSSLSKNATLSSRRLNAIQS